jgi:hypothetical protein
MPDYRHLEPQTGCFSSPIWVDTATFPLSEIWRHCLNPKLDPKRVDPEGLWKTIPVQSKDAPPAAA